LYREGETTMLPYIKIRPRPRERRWSISQGQSIAKVIAEEKRIKKMGNKNLEIIKVRQPKSVNDSKGDEIVEEKEKEGIT
jgi:hypothetical protein